jgi:hypothetical protein
VQQISFPSKAKPSAAQSSNHNSSQTNSTPGTASHRPRYPFEVPTPGPPPTESATAVLYASCTLLLAAGKLPESYAESWGCCMMSGPINGSWYICLAPALAPNVSPEPKLMKHSMRCNEERRDMKVASGPDSWPHASLCGAPALLLPSDTSPPCDCSHTGPWSTKGKWQQGAPTYHGGHVPCARQSY